MKTLMTTASLALLAAPVSAHTAAHPHVHSEFNPLLGLAAIACVSLAVFALKQLKS